MILIVFPTQWRGVVYSKDGIPISGATVNLRDRHTQRYIAETVADPEGLWNFDSYGTVYAGGDYTLEVINGAEKVTIWGGEVRVEVPEQAPWYHRWLYPDAPRQVLIAWVALVVVFALLIALLVMA